MNLLDPKLGGKARTLISVLSTVVVVLSSPAVTDFHWAVVATVLVGLKAVIDILTHLVGNDPKAA